MKHLYLTVEPKLKSKFVFVGFLLNPKSGFDYSIHNIIVKKDLPILPLYTIVY